MQLDPAKPHNSWMDEATVLGPVNVNFKAVHRMQKDAKRVYDDVSPTSKSEASANSALQVSRLLDLKQKYANAWEAHFSRVGSQKAAQQGKVGCYEVLFLRSLLDTYHSVRQSLCSLL